MDVGTLISISSTIKRMAATIIVLAAFVSFLPAQDDPLGQHVTVRMTDVKRQAVLRSLTRQTGYIFTFDTELVKPQEIVTVNIAGGSVRDVLNTLLPGGDLNYSVIENHIIIFRQPGTSTGMISEEGRRPVYNITGEIRELQTGEPLPYATIGIYRKGLGTVTNDEGRFSLKVPETALGDTLKISYLGFRDRTIPVNQAVDNYFVIDLERDYVPIPEVIIRTREPLDLINNMRRNIPENYGSTPVILTAFYRESVSDRNSVQVYSEAVLNIYKCAYTRSLRTDQVSIFKSRKIENIDNNDTLILKLQAGLEACLALDVIKNELDFVNPDNMGDYQYRMTDIVNIGEEAAYLVEFSQNENAAEPALFQGSLYINTVNYGLHAAEFRINEAYIDELSSEFVRASARQYSVRLKGVTYRIDYRLVNNRFFLNHVRGDLEFHARQRGRLFGGSYSIMFEMATTSIDSSQVERFARDLVAPTHSVFSETIEGYDPGFWGTDNYVQPEVGIEEALLRLNTKLGQFKRED